MKRIKVRIKFFLLILVLGLLTQNCINKNEVTKLNFELNKVIEIDTDSLNDGISDIIQPKNSNFILILNKIKNTVYILNFYNYKLEYLCKLNCNFIEGWFVDDKMKHIYTQTEDTIYKYNIDGVLLEKFLTPQCEEGYFAILNDNFVPIIKNNKMYYRLFANDENTFKSKSFFSQPIEASFDLKSKKINLLNTSYPFEYKNKCFGYNFDMKRFEISDNLHAYTFSYNDSIFIYNIDNKSIKKYYFGSKQFKEFKYIDFSKINTLNSSVFDELLYSNPFYGFDGYASISNIYYRFLFKTIKNGKIDFTKPILILYDSNFNYIGESDDSKNFFRLVDSNNGLLSIGIVNKKLIIYKLQWQSL